MSGGPIQTHRSWNRPAAEKIAPFSLAPTGNVADAIGPGVLAMAHQIKPLSPGSRVVGPALTVWTRGGDNLAPWLAIDSAQPGDVIVIATDDHRGSSTFGDLYAIAARNRGVAGIVTDGMCRDAAGIREQGIPAFVAGLMPNAPEKRGPGVIGGSIRCGGVVVRAGDVVVADDDGVVIVPQEQIDDVIERLQRVQMKEQRVAHELAAGQILPGWVDEYADAAGRQIID
jgi:4-hydroxy-4-methyl-2-oxoglutarate aldolase